MNQGGIRMHSTTKTTHRYDDIIDLPHHQSRTRPRMSRMNRAAQFAPFAALTGFDAAIIETGRLTDVRIELDESRKAALNEKLHLLILHLHDRPEVTITFFVPDKKKSGGAYLSVTGIIKRIDAYASIVIMEDSTIVPVGQIFEIESTLFAHLGDY